MSKARANADATSQTYIENATAAQELSGTYATGTERLYFNDLYTLTGDVTIQENAHLALGTIADKDVLVEANTGSTERTITGEGTLDSGNVLQDTHRTSLTDMTGELGSAVTGSPNLNLGNATFPAGHVLQDIVFRSGREQNALSATHVNFYEVSITLKSATSYVHAILNSTYQAAGNDTGGGVEIRRDTSATVVNSDTEISAYHAYDSAGPHDILYTTSGGTTWTRFVVMGSDTFSDITQTAGQTIYYAVFGRKYNASGTAKLPGGGSGGDSEFILRLTEVQQ